MERCWLRSLTHLRNVHHVCHESKAFQLQLGDEGLEEHVDLGKQSRGLSAHCEQHKALQSCRPTWQLLQDGRSPKAGKETPAGADRAHLGTGLLYAFLHRDWDALQQLLKLKLLLLRKSNGEVMEQPHTGQRSAPTPTAAGLHLPGRLHTSLTVMFLNSEDSEKTRNSSISLRVGFRSWLYVCIVSLVM